MLSALSVIKKKLGYKTPGCTQCNYFILTVESLLWSSYIHETNATRWGKKGMHSGKILRKFLHQGKFGEPARSENTPISYVQ